MYPSPELDVAIATATQRERIARGWRRRPARSAQSDRPAPARRTALRPGTSPA